MNVSRVCLPCEACAKEGSSNMKCLGIRSLHNLFSTLGLIQLNPLSVLTSICTFFTAHGPGRIGVLCCFHALMTHDLGHMPTSRSVFRSLNIQEAPITHHPPLLGTGSYPLVRDTHQHLFLLLFVSCAPQSPRLGNLLPCPDLPSILEHC